MSYEVIGVLGRGGSALVELAVDSNGGRVATKRVALTGSVEQMRVARRRLRREAEVLGRLTHPGIVPLIDVIDDGWDVILVFPALAENLEDRVGRLGPLPPGEVARIGRVLIEALAVAHRHGVVHRDIKPSNVLFDVDGEPALADFGVAVIGEITAGLTLAGTVVGTPMWMAPEQARGEPAGPASDVFSLAAALGFAATGDGPYAPGPPAVVMARAARDQIRAVSDSLSDAVRAPLVRMLDPRPEHRPSAAGVLRGLDGTTVTPLVDVGAASGAARPRRAPPLGGTGRRARSGHGRARRPARSWPARLLGDPPVGTRVVSRRRRAATVVAAVVAVAIVGLVVAVGMGGGAARRHPLASPAPASHLPTACTPLAYLACGASVPAPHTDGTVCDPGWYDLDGDAADGCEARSDYRAGTALTGRLHANLVPPSAVDSFTAHVHGNLLDFCWGKLDVTLTAPARTAEMLTVWNGTTRLAHALSANGAPATATVDKPSCFGADSENLRVTVAAVAASAGASAGNFTLARDAGW